MANVPPPDMRRSAPAVQRNREPILGVLERAFPKAGTVLELASGTGEHAIFFSDHLRDLTWQPSDIDAHNLESIAAWREFSTHGNVLAPIAIDLSSRPNASTALPSAALPSSRRYDAVFCANLIHIAPWIVCQNLMQVVAASLRSAGRFVMYGPYKIDGQHTAESNVAFEQWLWGQNPEYGVRDVADVVAEARLNTLGLIERVAMPANNFCLVFEKQ